MPSKSKKQARFMAAAAHNPKFAKKAGIKPSVAKEFNRADAGTGILKKAGGGLASLVQAMQGRAAPGRILSPVSPKYGRADYIPSTGRPVKQPAMMPDVSQDMAIGDSLRNLMGRIGPMRRERGGLVGLAQLRALAKKFREALEMGDEAQARRIRRQMELLKRGSTDELDPKAAELEIAEEKTGTFARGGKVR